MRYARRKTPRDREQGGAAPTVKTTYDNREVEAGRRGVRNPRKQIGSDTYGSCKAKAPKSKGDPHPQTIVLSGVLAAAQNGSCLSLDPAGRNVTHEKYLKREKISGHFSASFPMACQYFVGDLIYGGESEIRTHGTLRYTRFPSVRLKPLGHLSRSVNLRACRAQRNVASLTLPS